VQTLTPPTLTPTMAPSPRPTAPRAPSSPPPTPSAPPPATASVDSGQPEVETASATAAGPPYRSVDEESTGRIRGQLYFPSEYVPPLAVYAVALSEDKNENENRNGGRFYRVDTLMVPPGEPSYEIPLVEPGTYYVYGYPTSDEAPLGGSYSYLAACEAGHLAPPPGGCWEEPQHDLAPVEVRAGQAVEEINLFDWYGPPPPPPPSDTSAWPIYTNEQLAYHIRYPPHWTVQAERRGETTFGPPSPDGEGPGRGQASVRVTTGDPQEMADDLIESLPPGEVVAREWRTFYGTGTQGGASAGRNSLYLALELPDGHFAWWFVPRYELVYVVHAVTDSGRGSFDQMVETFGFEGRE